MPTFRDKIHGKVRFNWFLAFFDEKQLKRLSLLDNLNENEMKFSIVFSFKLNLIIWRLSFFFCYKYFIKFLLITFDR